MLLTLAVTGAVFLGLSYKFRHPIEYFHPHTRFRTLEANNISPSPSSMPKGSRKKFSAIAHYHEDSRREVAMRPSTACSFTYQCSRTEKCTSVRGVTCTVTNCCPSLKR